MPGSMFGFAYLRQTAVNLLTTGQLAGNARGDASVAQGLPERSEVVRLGGSYQCSIATGSAFTHVAAWPTTRAELVLKNNNSGSATGAGLKCFVIDSFWYANVATSVAAANSGTFLAQIVPSSATAVTDDTAQLITSRSGKSAYSGGAQRAVANTAYAIASKWEVVGSFSTSATASIGQGLYAPVYGGFILPPQSILCMNVALGTATGTGSIGVVWHEIVLDVGA